MVSPTTEGGDFMRRVVIGSLTLLLCVPAAWGLDEKGKDPPKAGTAAEQFQALKKEFTTALEKAQKEFTEATAQEDKQKVVQKFQEVQGSIGAKMMELAEKNSKDGAAVDALAWVLMNDPKPQDRQKAYTALTTDQLMSDNIGAACSAMFRMPDGEKQVRTIIEKNTNKNAQGQARLALANFLKGKAGRSPSDDEKEKLTKEATTLLEEIVAKYADVKSGEMKLGDAAKAQLAGIKAMANLVVGKEAPDIVGPDADGKEFKLSDYRGKVVLLDFWAHW
jgi:hypothetical protein